MAGVTADTAPCWFRAIGKTEAPFHGLGAEVNVTGTHSTWEAQTCTLDGNYQPTDTGPITI